MNISYIKRDLLAIFLVNRYNLTIRQAYKIIDEKLKELL